MCIGQSQSPSPPPPPFHLGIHTFVLYIYACISPVQISSCVPFFYLYVLIYDVFLFLTYCCALRVLAPESVWSACLMVMTRIYSLVCLCGAHTGDSTVVHRPEQVALILKSLKVLVCDLLPLRLTCQSLEQTGLLGCVACVCVVHQNNQWENLIILFWNN